MQVYWTGDDPETGHNQFRQAMIHHVLPRIGGKPVMPPLAVANTLDWSQPWQNQTDQDNQEKFITEGLAETPFEVYWLDAWWHRGGYPAGMGNYTFPVETAMDPVRFSRGMKPISDAARAQGLKFLLWFAPEEVQDNSTLARQHPEWVLQPADSKQHGGGSYNLGLPEARAHMTGFMDACIKEWRIDVWRTDGSLNLDNLKANEKEPDRLGIQEIRCMEGLYRLWDDLLAGNPGLTIDNCAGGGTRIDLETCARSIPFWRTDAQALPMGQLNADANAILNQIGNASLNRYVPASGGVTRGIEPYSMRSSYNGGFTLPDTFNALKAGKAEITRAIVECGRLRRYYFGDFYRLLYTSADAKEWCVYQYHLPHENAGVILAFRRHESPDTSAEVAAKGVEPATGYEVTFFETYDPLKTMVMKGSEMKKLVIEIASKPGSTVIEYRKAE
jgi:alpha-galactosidase